MLGHVESTCEPDDEFLTRAGDSRYGLRAFGREQSCGHDHRRPNAMEVTGTANRSVAATRRRGQWLTAGVGDSRRHALHLRLRALGRGRREGAVCDRFRRRNGDIALVSPVSPILDAGGNVAISPSGRRVALLNAAPSSLRSSSGHAAFRCRIRSIVDSTKEPRRRSRECEEAVKARAFMAPILARHMLCIFVPPGFSQQTMTHVPSLPPQQHH